MATAEVREFSIARAHPRKVGDAKAFLQAGLGLTEPEAHLALQRFASSGQIRLEDAAEIVCRLVKAIGRVKGNVRP